MRFRDKRRKHEHWRATIYYADGEKFSRVYISRGRARAFCVRQALSPIVERTRVTRD